MPVFSMVNTLGLFPRFSKLILRDETVCVRCPSRLKSLKFQTKNPPAFPE